MMPVTILSITVSTVAKNSTTTAPFFPIDPKMVPNTRQKTIIPKVFVPDRYLTYNNNLFLDMTSNLQTSFFALIFFSINLSKVVFKVIYLYFLY